LWFSRSHLYKKGTLDNGKSPNKKNKSNANTSLFSVATLPQRGIPLINRLQIKVKARLIAETFIVESICELPPPLLKTRLLGFTF